MKNNNGDCHLKTKSGTEVYCLLAGKGLEEYAQAFLITGTMEGLVIRLRGEPAFVPFDYKTFDYYPLSDEGIARYRKDAMRMYLRDSPGRECTKMAIRRQCESIRGLELYLPEIRRMAKALRRRAIAQRKLKNKSRKEGCL